MAATAAGLCTAADQPGSSARVGGAALQREPQPGQETPGHNDVLPQDQELERRKAVIGKIEIRVEDVFNPELPGEDWWPYRLVNTLHISTRDKVVRDLLLFAEGDPYSRRILDETERLLRADKLFFDAWVRPVRVRGQQVDVEVVVRDVWTLTAGVRFRREGGQNQTGINLQDRNFLGTGKDIDLERRTDVDRTTTLVRYRDPNLRGSRTRLDAQYASTSDGWHRSLELDRPFYELDARWAAGGLWLSESLIDHRYLAGHRTDSFLHDRTFGELSGGLSAGLSSGFARRWRAGVTYDSHEFARLADQQGSVVPDDRTLVYPWVGLELLEDSYAKMKNMDQIIRTEDFHLGRSLSARLGWSSRSFGADRTMLVFAATASSTSQHDGGLTRLSAHASGRWSRTSTENVLLGGSVDAYWQVLGRHKLFASLSADLAHRLDRERQLLIGGDSGLRGYPLRYQDGDRRVLLSVEQRFYTDWHPLKLAHVGAAVFADVGHSWFAEDGFGSGGGVLSDVGFGLRLSSSRSGSNNMLHVDLAFPLNRDGDISGIQFSVKTKSSF